MSSGFGAQRTELECRLHRDHRRCVGSPGREDRPGRRGGRALPDFHGLLAREGQRTECLYAFDLLHLRATDLEPRKPSVHSRPRVAETIRRRAASAHLPRSRSAHIPGMSLGSSDCRLGEPRQASCRAHRPERTGNYAISRYHVCNPSCACMSRSNETPQLCAFGSPPTLDDKSRSWFCSSGGMRCQRIAV
jgi:hypothetical protein